MKNLKEKYIENAFKYSEAINLIFDRSNPINKEEYSRYSKIEKKAFKKCHELFLLLKEINELEEIEELMHNNSPYVRYISSAHCLYSNPIIAEKTLENLIESNLGDVSMKALATLKAWRKIPWTEDRYK